MTLQTLKRTCETRESLRSPWKALVDAAFEYQRERLSLAEKRVETSDTPPPSSYTEKEGAFVSAKDAFVLQCGKDGVEIPEDLSAGAISRLYYD